MNINEIFQKRRKELQMTQRELAEMINVSDKTISRWELGTQIPDTMSLEPLAKALQISIEQLLFL